MRTTIAIVTATLLLASARLSRAAVDGSAGDRDGGADDAAAEDAAAQEGAPVVPLACDGALCDTTNGAETGGSCSAAGGKRPTGPVEPIAWAIATLGVGLVRRTRRQAPCPEGPR